MFRASITDCKRWLSGHCSFGDRCHFRHDPAKRGFDPNAKQTVTSRQDTDCHYWLKGSCKFGDHCRYRHDPDKKCSALRDSDATGEKDINLVPLHIVLLIFLHVVSKLIFILFIIDESPIFRCSICHDSKIPSRFPVLSNCIHKFHPG